MRLANQTITKTRNIGGFIMEMQVANIRNEGIYQATYYKGAEPFIWGETFPSELEAIQDVDSMVTEKAKQFPTVYGQA